MSKFGAEAAREDLKRVLQWRDSAIHHGTNNNHPPELVLAIISRETRGLNVIGDHGHGHGLMQIDNRQSKDMAWWCQDWVEKGMDPDAGIQKGCEILRNKRMALVRLGVQLDREEFLRAYVAAFNTGEGNVLKSVRAGLDVDTTTAFHNYSKDVLARVPVFKEALLCPP